MPQEKCLLIIDMLNDFTLPGAPLEVPDNRKIIAPIKTEIASARARGNPVIYACDNHDPEDREFRKFGWPPHAVKGSFGAEIVQELKPEKEDIIIKKSTYSLFYNTKLKETLDKLSIKDLRLAGCLTHMCILFTAYEAVLMDYGVVVVEDAVADIKREDHLAALRFMKDVGINLEEAR